MSRPPEIPNAAQRHCEPIAIEAGPAEQSGARGPMTSVYCRDPDGNLIEVATYGAGPPPALEKEETGQISEPREWGNR